MSKTLRILLIDDNPDDRLLAIRGLTREFTDLQIQEVINTEDLHQALARDNFDFDVVITDYLLGWSDGITVLSAIKAQFPNCPVVMFTNSGNEEIAVEAMKRGLDDYIIKSPKHFMRLARAVRSVLERVRQQQALKEAERQYRRLFEDVPIGLYRSTPTGQFIDANPALVQMVGYPDKNSLLAINLADLYVEKSTYYLWQEELEQAGVLPNSEVQLHRYDGTSLWVLNSTTAIRDSGGELLYYEGAIEDINDRKLAEEERNQLLIREQAARKDAETANRVKDEFLATLSHELRTPLNAILGWAKMLRHHNFDEKTATRALETIERNAVAQTKLIEELLDISRIIRGKLRLNLRKVDLGLIITTTLETMKPAAEAKKIAIASRFNPSVSSFVGDPERLQQIVWNLLSNAVKFTSSGGFIAVELDTVKENSTSSTFDGEYLQIRVTDTGMGIPPEVLPHIFERFSQADSSTTRSHGGLGLGLAIVRHLVELHGGTVTAESLGANKGATFTVRLPCSKETQAEDPSGPLIYSSSSRLKGVRALVVEDDADSREFLVTVLEEEGATVTAVGSVKEALIAWEKHPPDVLLSDIGMPEEDGYVLIQQIRQKEAETGKRPLPAIALTAYAMESDRDRAIAAGFQKHLAKPVDPSTVVKLVSTLAKQGVT